MKLRRPLAALLAGAGIAAAANDLLAARAGPLDPGLPGEFDTYRFRGMDVAYTERGDRDDPDILLLHGINAAASSHEFARVHDALAADHRVVAPDLPGFGRSDRPPVDYDATLYVDFVESFAADVVEAPTVIASSLAGAYAAVAARSASVSGVVLICPTATTLPGRRPWLRAFLRSPVVGSATFNALASKPSIRAFYADHGFYDPGAITPDLVEYDWRAAHQPGARFAPASFVSGHLDPDADLGGTLAAVDAPATLAWGREADIVPLARGRRLAEDADARLVVFDRARLLPHAEYPGPFVEGVAPDLPGMEE